MVIAFHFNDFFNGRYPEVLAKLELVFFNQLLHVNTLLFESFNEEGVAFFDVEEVDEWSVKDFLKDLDLIFLWPKLANINIPILQLRIEHFLISQLLLIEQALSPNEVNHHLEG